MLLHLKSPGSTPGVYPLVQRGRDLKYLSFTVIELGGKLGEHTFDTGGGEVSLDFYTGPVGIDAEGGFGTWTTEIPARTSIADAHPMVYIPAQARVRVRALDSSARITVAGAEGRGSGEPRRISDSEIVAKSVGKENWNRTVYTHIADNVPATHLIAERP